jgi:Flp pilus assembly protein TadD
MLFLCCVEDAQTGNRRPVNNDNLLEGRDTWKMKAKEKKRKIVRANKYAVLILIVLMGHLLSCTGNTQNQRKKEAQAYRNVGEAYMNQGNYSAALGELLKAEKLDPDDPLLHNDLGLCYLVKKRFDQAITHFSRAVELKPDYAPARNNLGTAYLMIKDWDAAIATFEEITRDLLYGTPHYPLSNLGLAYYNKGDYTTAERYYREALEIEPEFVLALRGIGKTYLAQGKAPKAVRALERAVALAPENAALQMDLGNAYKYAGEPVKAKFAYEKVMTLDPNGPLGSMARQALGTLY